ncbi:MAG: ACT domain-containing protein, partial [Ilumatobacteraceae bacterium]
MTEDARFEDGETDLARMLATLDVSVRPGSFAFVVGPWPALEAMAVARIDEAEGVTLVVDSSAARAAGAPVGFEAAWVTLDVHSSLSAVGLTAWFSSVLADAGIACNVLAGFHHDHLLVPHDRA